MKILHTSDWHLGKNLEGYSRMDEQELFLKEFIDIVKENNVDLVIIAGDIYDNVNPPARAENMFYNTLKQITDNGKTAVLVISGNHDNPDRLAAINPLAYDQGIIIVGMPKDVIPIGKCGNFNIVDSGQGYIEMKIGEENIIVITLPYPSEKRLDEVISNNFDEEIRRKDYSERVGKLFDELSKKYREDTINIAVSHIFVAGGETTDSERPIELGGSLAVDTNKLPEKAQYIALGHLHKPQQVKNNIKARYSGSPLQYSKSEIGYSKCCYLVDLKAEEKASIEPIFFNNYKPIEVWKCNGVEEAIEKCRQNSDKNMWAYIEIKTEEFISQENIKAMKDLKEDIVEIKPIIEGMNEEQFDLDDIKNKSIGELFEEFYINERGVSPRQEVKDLFLHIFNGE